MPLSPARKQENVPRVSPGFPGFERFPLIINRIRMGLEWSVFLFFGLTKMI
jgi:hypothetical protein